MCIAGAEEGRDWKLRVRATKDMARTSDRKENKHTERKKKFVADKQTQR